MKKRKISLKKKVMESIKKKKIKMRPKFYFIAGSILLGAGLALAIITAILFLNFTIFRFRVHTPLAYLRFGKLGLTPFLLNFPIIPIILSIIGIIAGITLIKKYDISYKKNYLGIVVGLFSFVAILGFFLEKTSFNERIAQRNNLPQFIRGKFDGDSWVAGQVVEINESELVVQTLSQKMIIVERNEKTLLPTGDNIEKEDHIRVTGKWENDKFIAEGILLPKNPKGLNKEVRGLKIQRGVNK